MSVLMIMMMPVHKESGRSCSQLAGDAMLVILAIEHACNAIKQFLVDMLSSSCVLSLLYNETRPEMD